MTSKTISIFSDFALIEPILKALDDVGYETPSPIQAETIPLLLQGKDVLGQAQTGTGKTAAFALPLLSNLDLNQKDPQVLVLAPTRELAIQVAEAFQKYARHLKGFHVLPVYGGQDYRGQIRALERGVHVVVGTPGRVMDHMRRKTLKLDNLKALVLDEADEMLRMGFIDDVEWILEQTPEQRQIALFSATMPQQIRRIATKYLNDPHQITIKVQTATADTIRQRFWPVSGLHKLDALTRILEAEPFDAMIIFVRTKIATVELSDKLEARGYATAPLSGDILQKQRERTIENLKNGKLDIIVATDVAARGLDVKRVSHVLNYDIPYDAEAYIHRVGRTGRAGKQGDAILFVAPREKRLLHAIEKATNKKIDMMELPSTEDINDQRIIKFKQRITDTLATEELGMFYQMIEQYQQEHNVPALEVGAALAHLLQGETPFLLQNKPEHKAPANWERDDDRPARRPQGRSGERERSAGRDSRPATTRSPAGRGSSRSDSGPEEGMARFRIEVGHKHEVKPGNIVGAIANEAGMDSKFIGRISIHEDHSTLDLPADMSKDVLQSLKKVWVAGQQLQISNASDERSPASSERRPRPPGGDDSRKPDYKSRSKAKENNSTGYKARTQVKEEGGAGFSKPRFKGKDDSSTGFSKPRPKPREESGDGFSKPRFKPRDDSGAAYKPRPKPKGEGDTGFVKPRPKPKEDVGTTLYKGRSKSGGADSESVVKVRIKDKDEPGAKVKKRVKDKSKAKKDKKKKPKKPKRKLTL